MYINVFLPDCLVFPSLRDSCTSCCTQCRISMTAIIVSETLQMVEKTLMYIRSRSVLDVFISRTRNESLTFAYTRNFTCSVCYSESFGTTAGSGSGTMGRSDGSRLAILKKSSGMHVPVRSRLRKCFRSLNAFRKCGLARLSSSYTMCEHITR